LYFPYLSCLNFKLLPLPPQKIEIENPVKVKNPEKWDYGGACNYSSACGDSENRRNEGTGRLNTCFHRSRFPGRPQTAGGIVHCEDRGIFRILAADFDFAFFHRLFYRILGKAIKPLKIERLFCPDYGLEEQVQIVVTAFAYIPMGHVKIIAPGKGIMYGLFANITGKGFHGIYTPCWLWGKKLLFP
jgi:hypothetical protein